VKTCFVICPIGCESSESFRFANGLFSAAIVPVLEKAGKYLKVRFDPTISHMIAEPGSITFQIIDRLLNSDLVIANLTTKNANVMYELAVRHAIAKPVVSIFEDGTVLPFDLKDDRAFSYRNDIPGIITLKDKLHDAIVKAMENPNLAKDNPIYRARSISQLLAADEPSNMLDFAKGVLDEFKKLQTQAPNNIKMEFRIPVSLPKDGGSTRNMILNILALQDSALRATFDRDVLIVQTEKLRLDEIVSIVQNAGGRLLPIN
jgi:hypothetical protein